MSLSSCCTGSVLCLVGDVSLSQAKTFLSDARQSEVDILYSWTVVVPKFSGGIVFIRVQTLSNTHFVASGQSPDFSGRRRRPNLHSNHRRSVSNNREALLSWLVLSMPPDTFGERRTHCLSRNFVLLIKRTRHLKETRNLIRLFGY